MYSLRPLLRFSALSLVLLAAACERSELPTQPPSEPLFAKPASPGGGGGGGDDGGDSTTPSSRDPILFVHGWNSDASTWNTMIERFKQDGWADSELYAMTYTTSKSNAEIADSVAAEVEKILATGATKVDIITHSMGGLSSRYYLKHYNGDAPVDAWVSLGGPNHGTTTANGCVEVSCVEMRVDSEFLKALNTDDETPNVARYATWWSSCDEWIDPNDSVILLAPDASNTKTGCLTHSRLKEDSKVYRQVRDYVAAGS